jgi:hypothetical protein
MPAGTNSTLAYLGQLKDHCPAVLFVYASCVPPLPPQGVLKLVQVRETRYRVQWYYGLFESTMRCLSREPRTGAMPTPGDGFFWGGGEG